MPPRTTRATSVARTKEAEPPSRRTRAASVSANKRPDVVKKAAATPKRKRSASAGPRARSISQPRGEPAAKRRESGRTESGRAKRTKLAQKEDAEVEEAGGRRSEREEVDTDEDAALNGRPEDEWRIIRNAPDGAFELGERFMVPILRCEKERRDRRQQLDLYYPNAFGDARNEHNLRFAVFKQDTTACYEGSMQQGNDGMMERERDELKEMLEQLRSAEEHELRGKDRTEGDATPAKIEEVARMFESVKTELEMHDEKMQRWMEWVEKAVKEGVVESQKQWFIGRYDGLVKEERRLAEKYGDETRKQLSGRNGIREEKLLEMRRKLEDAKTLPDPPKATPKSRVRGAYSDTLERGVVKAQLPAKQNRTRLKEVADEKEKAAKEFEDLKAEFAEGIEFYEGGGTNKAMIKGYKEKMEEIAELEEEYKEVKGEREDPEKVKAFMAKLEAAKNNWSAMEKKNGYGIYEKTRKKLEKGKEVGIIDQYVNKDCTVVEKEAGFRLQGDGALVLNWGEGEVEKVASPPPPATSKKPTSTDERPKKTPRRKSIRMGALSIFTPGGTRANSEAIEDDPTPSSPLSPPPAERDQPQAYTLASGLPSIRRPESISWATPVSEIQDFLTHTQEANAYKDFLPGNVYGPSTEQLQKFAFHPRPIGFKCPGHKREWRGAEQTKDLIIYRDWLNFPHSKDKEQLYAFFMTPRDISKPPTLENMKSLKDWKAWGAGVFTGKEKGGVKRTLYVFDPELGGKEVEKMKKTGELSKLQQLLVGAVKRCRGGIEEVVIEGRGKDGGKGEKDSFAMTAEWANEIIGMAGMHMKDRKTKKLEIAK